MRGLGVIGWHPHQISIAIWTTTLVFTTVAVKAQEATERAWVNKRVVPKHSEFHLKAEIRANPVEVQGDFYAAMKTQRFDDRETGSAWLSRPAGTLALMLTYLPTSAQQIAEPTANGDWIGKRVVQKERDFQLRVQKQVIDRKGVLTIYRVEQMNGQWVWLHADGLAGWARAEQLLAVDEALAFYGDFIRDHPDDAFGYSMRGTILLEEKKDLDAALSDYTAAIRLDPTNAALHVNRANGWAARKEYDKAVADFDEAIRLEPAQPFALSGRGLTRYAKQEIDKAIADLSEAIKLDPELAIAYNGRGLAWKRKGDFDKAIGDFTEAIRLDPQNALAHEHRGFGLYAKRDYAKSIAEFDAAIGLDSRDFVAYLGRGCAWYSKKDYAKAIADFDEAIRLDPQNAKAYVYRASSLYGKTEYEKAISDYTEAIRIDPRSPDAYDGRGCAWNAKHEDVQAIADFTEAIRLDPRYAKAYADRASVWYAKTEYDKAIADDSEAIQLDPTQAGVHVDRGDAWREKGQWTKAAADYTEAIRLRPDLADGYNGQAWLSAACPDVKHRDGKRAVELASKSCELSHWKEPNNIDTLAAAYAEIGDFPSAVKWQAKAVALSTDDNDKEAYANRLKRYRTKQPYRLDLP